MIVAPHAHATALAVLQALAPGAVVGTRLPQLLGGVSRGLDVDHVLDLADASLVPAGPDRSASSRAWRVLWRASGSFSRPG